jgi:hypothetical protein
MNHKELNGHEATISTTVTIGNANRIFEVIVPCVVDVAVAFAP